MPVSSQDVGMVVRVCAQHCVRVTYGVLGAALSQRAGNPAARQQDYGNATGAMVNKALGVGPVASWAVGVNGFPSHPDYGTPPNSNYDQTWSINTPLYHDLYHEVQRFLNWLDATAPGWDSHMQSTFP